MIDRRPDAVLFDAGNTLVFVDAGRVQRLLVPFGADPSPERFTRVERAARGRLARRVGRAVATDEAGLWRDYFVDLFAGLGVPGEVWETAGAAVRQAHRRAHLWTRVDPATPAALRRLLDAKLRLAVISNADGRVPALLGEVGLARYFEFVLDSDAVGVAKPDPRIFRMAAERLGLPPARCLYVGDLFAFDVVGARRAGMPALLVDPFDDLDVDVPRVPSVAHLPAVLGADDGGGGAEAGVRPI